MGALQGRTYRGGDEEEDEEEEEMVKLVGLWGENGRGLGSGAVGDV
jgi:hypothetical protein